MDGDCRCGTQLANIPLLKRGYDIYSRMGLATGEKFRRMAWVPAERRDPRKPLLLLAADRCGAWVAEGRRSDLIFCCAACLVFGLLFAARAGMGLLFNIYLTRLIRAQERIFCRS